MNLSINNIWSPECSDWRCLSSEKWLPRSIVRHDLVHVADIDHILGLALVVGDAGVLEPVAPEDLIGKVAGSDLDHKTVKCPRVPRLHSPAQYSRSLGLFPLM